MTARWVDTRVSLDLDGRDDFTVVDTLDGDVVLAVGSIPPVRIRLTGEAADALVSKVRRARGERERCKGRWCDHTVPYGDGVCDWSLTMTRTDVP